jgi:hypothetical protein
LESFDKFAPHFITLVTFVQGINYDIYTREISHKGAKYFRIFCVAWSRFSGAVMVVELTNFIRDSIATLDKLLNEARDEICKGLASLLFIVEIYEG